MGLQTSNSDLAAFAAEAARFVMTYMDPIPMSAPHIYLSALPWSPRESKIAQHVLPEFSQKFHILTRQDNDWPATQCLVRSHGHGYVCCILT
jgi:hypothetical protein